MPDKGFEKLTLVKVYSVRILEIKTLANNDKSWCVKREGRQNFKRNWVETNLEKVVPLLIAQFGLLHCLGPGDL